MKARISPRQRLSKEIKEASIQYTRDKIEKERISSTQRIFKLVFYQLHRDYGFGKDRLARLLKGVTDTINAADEDEAFWEHIDQIVIDEIGLDFPRERLNLDGGFLNDE